MYGKPIEKNKTANKTTVKVSNLKKLFMRKKKSGNIPFAKMIIRQKNDITQRIHCFIFFFLRCIPILLGWAKGYEC